MAHPWDLFVSPDSGLPLMLDDTRTRLVTDDGAECWPIGSGIPDLGRNGRAGITRLA
jgi:hypothetical protein